MESLLQVLSLTLLFAGCLFALASLVIGLPGTFLIVAIALIYGWSTDFELIRWATIGWLLGIAVVGEGIELAATTAATAGTRPSRRVTVGALVGAIAGAITGAPFFFGVGALFGALAGAFAGAYLAVRSEGGTIDESVATGIAAMKGRLLGFVLKVSLAAVMVVIIATAVL